MSVRRMIHMPKKEEIKLDPKLLDGEAVSYPCTGCKEICKNTQYKSCTKWKKWIHMKWREVTTELKRKR